MHFDYYADNATAGSSPAAGGDELAPGHRVIDLPAVDQLPEGEEQIMRQLVAAFAVPPKLRFMLLQKASRRIRGGRAGRGSISRAGASACERLQQPAAIRVPLSFL